MVQIKPLIAFLLAAATIADVVAQPVAFRGMGAVGGAVRKFRGGSRHRHGGTASSITTESQSER